MAWIADASLASAVSNAGGLGIISAMNANADWVREEIRKCRAATDKPFGVNIMLMSPHVEEVAKMVAEEKVPVVTTGAGNPSRFVKMWKDAGIVIIPVVASTALAKMVERAGVDAVIAEGGESGGGKVGRHDQTERIGAAHRLCARRLFARRHEKAVCYFYRRKCAGPFRHVCQRGQARMADETFSRIARRLRGRGFCAAMRHILREKSSSCSLPAHVLDSGQQFVLESRTVSAVWKLPIHHAIPHEDHAVTV